MKLCKPRAYNQDFTVTRETKVAQKNQVNEACRPCYFGEDFFFTRTDQIKSCDGKYYMNSFNII